MSRSSAVSALVGKSVVSQTLVAVTLSLRQGLPAAKAVRAQLGLTARARMPRVPCRIRPRLSRNSHSPLIA